MASISKDVELSPIEINSAVEKVNSRDARRPTTWELRHISKLHAVRPINTKKR